MVSPPLGENKIKDKKHFRIPSEFLLVVTGGIVGASSGLAMSLVASIHIVAGLLGFLAGAAFAILLFRRKSRMDLERVTKKSRIALDFIKAELASMPESAPSYIREELIFEYHVLCKQYCNLAGHFIEKDDISGYLKSKQTGE